MIELVGTPPFLRIALRVVMAAMHFHIAQTDLFLGNIFLHLGVPGNNLASMKKKNVLGVQGRSN